VSYVFVDRIDECEPGARAVGQKALSLNEELFRDHFPGMPVLPGTMILEGFVQVARHCMSAVDGGHDQWILKEAASLRFNRFAVPGETLTLEIEHESNDEGVVWFKGRAKVGDQGVCRARFGVSPRNEAAD
jgi:3-hydroxyacyl-[acyl-carrier-protein] dehydratase